MDLLDLMVKIGVSDEASSKIGDISAKIKSGLSNAAKIGAAATAAMGAAVVGSVNSFAAGVAAVAEYGDNIDKMSQKMGMSATSFQEWSEVMQHSGTSMESMKAGMKTLANAAETGNEAFERLGITQEQIASMSQEELFAATIEGLQGVEDTTERTYLAGQLLGRGATELGPLLNMTAEETEAMRQRVHELGGVMSEDAVKAAAAFQDSLQDMRTAASGLKNRMLAEFLPGMTTVMDGLQEVFAGNYDEGLAKISEGISQVAEKAHEIVPQFIELGSGLMSVLGQAISENLPTILGALTDVVIMISEQIPQLVETLVPVLIGLAPRLMEGGLQMFMGILQALAAAAPQIASALVEAVSSFINMIRENGPAMLAAAGEFFMAILQALWENGPQLLADIGGLVWDAIGAIAGAVGDMLGAALEFMGGLLDGTNEGGTEVMNYILTLPAQIVGAFLGLGAELFSAGLDAMAGLAAGIEEGARGVLDAIGSVTVAVTDIPIDGLEIGSPSKVFKRYGGWAMEGFALGIEGKSGMATAAMRRAMGAVSSSARLVMPTPQYTLAGAVSGGNNVTVNLTLDYGADSTALDMARGVANILDDYLNLEA